MTLIYDSSRAFSRSQGAILVLGLTCSNSALHRQRTGLDVFGKFGIDTRGTIYYTELSPHIVGRTFQSSLLSARHSAQIEHPGRSCSLLPSPLSRPNPLGKVQAAICCFGPSPSTVKNELCRKNANSEDKMHCLF
jgi:hypothetical protein